MVPLPRWNTHTGEYHCTVSHAPKRETSITSAVLIIVVFGPLTIQLIRSAQQHIGSSHTYLFSLDWCRRCKERIADGTSQTNRRGGSSCCFASTALGSKQAYRRSTGGAIVVVSLGRIDDNSFARQKFTVGKKRISKRYGAQEKLYFSSNHGGMALIKFHASCRYCDVTTTSLSKCNSNPLL